MITLVDYGLGNIKAFANVYKQLNIPINIATNADELRQADKVILPGVGAFDYAMLQLNKSGMRPVLDELVLETKIPVIGICVGMQIMAHNSDEGELPGLGWIDAEVKKFTPIAPGTTMQLPHMGWNDVKEEEEHPLFNELDSNSRFYFLHSYYFRCNNQKNVLATSEYHGKFTSAVHCGNIFGVQFHPEKSHQYGIQLLKNFANI